MAKDFIIGRTHEYTETRMSAIILIFGIKLYLPLKSKAKKKIVISSLTYISFALDNF